MWFGIVVAVGAVAFTLGKEYGRRIYPFHSIDCSYLEVRTHEGEGRAEFKDATYKQRGPHVVVIDHDGGGRRELSYRNVSEIICRYPVISGRK